MSSLHLNNFVFFFTALSYSLLDISSPAPPSDLVEPNGPQISELLVSHYDCSKQHILRQFSLTRYSRVLKCLLL